MYGFVGMSCRWVVGLSVFWSDDRVVKCEKIIIKGNMHIKENTYNKPVNNSVLKSVLS